MVVNIGDDGKPGERHFLKVMIFVTQPTLAQQDVQQRVETTFNPDRSRQPGSVGLNDGTAVMRDPPGTSPLNDPGNFTKTE
ncbi:hypothetical protein SDC9_172902 [bioreactor metagenome]|uniref:Uncharacterized protein n=1 Tax=bioreactor metagenome TaxID=1076179 RepID=A0A645GEZ8_9ZZZZ